jgi:hypothetical protein
MPHCLAYYDDSSSKYESTYMRCKRKKEKKIAVSKEIIFVLPVGSTSREILIASDVARS